MTSNWRVAPLRHLIGSIKNGTWGDDPLDDGTDVLCVRAADFDRQKMRVEPSRAPMRHVSPRDHRHLLKRGDLVIEKSGGGEDQPVGAVVRFDLEDQAVCSNFAARIVPAPGIESRYLTYLMASMYLSGVTRKWIKQTTGIQNLDTGGYQSEPCLVPPLDEQRKIADFLDVETARMDRLIELRGRTTALAAERAEALLAPIPFS